ncbi:MULTISPECIES: DUF2470 domain-containing protein [Helicobacter]|uniref:DUF2470 domain-containing protein n=1 Tax=Helicobacter TaxID=209 RepID=UPI000EAE2559|nr:MULTISPECIES: DUF2470 domain-containing protein [Helicobacter]
METRVILDHMNKHHVRDMEALLARYGHIEGARNVSLKNATLEGIEIAYILEGIEEVLHIAFPISVESTEGIRGAIIALCTSISPREREYPQARDRRIEAESFSREAIPQAMFPMVGGYPMGGVHPSMVMGMCIPQVGHVYPNMAQPMFMGGCPTMVWGQPGMVCVPQGFMPPVVGVPSVDNFVRERRVGQDLECRDIPGGESRGRDRRSVRR